MWRRYGDWALALVLCAVGELQFCRGLPSGVQLAGGGVPSAVLFAPVALGLAWRRSHPVVVLVVATACFCAGSLFVLSRVDSGPVAFFLALLAIYYSAGAWGRGRAALVTSSAAFAAMVALDATRGLFDVNGPKQPVAWALFVIVWIVGREIGRRRGDVLLLEARTRRLERDREEKARAAVDEERGRIARELHDVVAHSVSVMVVQAQAGPRLMADPDRTRAAFAAIERSGREALVELRRMLGILRTRDERAAAAPQPGLGSLAGLLGQIRDAGLAVECVVDGDERPLPVGVDLSAFRIVQEALTNTLKHAHSQRASVSLHYGTSWLDIEVLDDGRGEGPPVRDGTGHGLIGMRERVALYRGELTTGPHEGGGFVVRARLPLNGSHP